MSYLSIESSARTNLELMSKGVFKVKPYDPPSLPSSPVKKISTQEIAPQISQSPSDNYNRTFTCLIVIISTLALGILYGRFLHPGCYGIAGIGVIPLFILFYQCARPTPAQHVEEEETSESSDIPIPKVPKPCPQEELNKILVSVTYYLNSERETILQAVSKFMSSKAFTPKHEDRLTPKQCEEEVLKERPGYASIIQFAKQAKESIPKVDNASTTAFISACATVCGSNEAKVKRVVCFHRWPTSYSPAIKEASHHPFSSVVQHKETVVIDSMFKAMNPYNSTPVKPTGTGKGSFRPGSKITFKGF